MHQVPISFTSVLGIFLIMSSRASEMLWQMSGKCLTALMRRIRGRAANASEQFPGFSVVEPYSASGQHFQAMRCLLRELFHLDTCDLPRHFQANV